MRTEVQITLQRKFTRESDNDAFALIRLSNAHTKALGGRNTWVRLKGVSGRSVFRMIQGAGNIEMPIGAMECDYDTNLSLGTEKASPNGAGFYPCNVSVRAASGFEILVAHWQHPNHYYRFPLQISLVGLFLGVTGLVLGVLSLF